MAAITWRNVSGPSLAEASRPLEAAQRSIDNAFTGLGGVLRQQESTDAANWNQVKENNTQDFLNKLYSAQGAEGFKALQDSGELERMLAANGAQIDRAAARSAMDGRLGTLQQRDVTDINYRNTMTDEAQAPEVRRIQMLTLTNPAAAQAELAANPGLRSAVQLAQGIDTRQQTLTDRDREATRFSFEQTAEERKAAEEAQRKLLRPLEVEGKNVSLANDRSRGEGINLQNKNSRLTLKQTEQQIKDADETKRLEDVLANAIQTRRQSVETDGRNMGIIARSANLPVNAAGQPDFSKYTSEQLDAFDAAAGANRQITVPKARDFMQGDTAAANTFLSNLEQSKQFRPALVQKFRDQIRSNFDSTVSSNLVGNDAANNRLAAARSQVMLEDTKANNWFTPGSPTARTAYEELANDAPNLIDKASGNSPEEDIGYIQNFVFEMATRGVETKPGSGIFITPPTSVVRSAIRSAKGGWFADNARANAARKQVEDYLKTPGAQKQIAEAEQAAVLLRNQRVQSILNPAK
jgi:hypothetical protein